MVCWQNLTIRCTFNIYFAIFGSIFISLISLTFHRCRFVVSVHTFIILQYNIVASSAYDCLYKFILFFWYMFWFKNKKGRNSATLETWQQIDCDFTKALFLLLWNVHIEIDTLTAHKWRNVLLVVSAFFVVFFVLISMLCHSIVKIVSNVFFRPTKCERNESKNIEHRIWMVRNRK